MTRVECAVLVAGAGPAGIAAACRVAESGRRVTVVDDNPTPGGQIWRGARVGDGGESGAWLERLAASGAEVLSGARIIAGVAREHTLIAETEREAFEIRYEKAILATGARERFLPFPRWTLPNAVGAGGLQALVKSGVPIAGKRVVVAGTGPLLMAVAAYVARYGAVVRVIAEQASWGRIARFGIGLARFPGKLAQAWTLRPQSFGARYLADCWPEEALGENRVRAVRLRQRERSWEEPCDYLACGFGLCVNLELPLLLGCAVQAGVVQVDGWQQTSLADVFCAGEPAGIGGVELALIEGQIAGCAASGRMEDARRLFPARQKLRGFARGLERAFALRPELKTLSQRETFVCRCEDVSFERMRAMDSWRSAKLQMRCGMGPCQGRICGPAAEFLFGWDMDSVRPPLFPARIESLIG